MTAAVLPAPAREWRAVADALRPRRARGRPGPHRVAGGGVVPPPAHRGRYARRGRAGCGRCSGTWPGAGPGPGRVRGDVLAVAADVFDRLRASVSARHPAPSAALAA